MVSQSDVISQALRKCTRTFGACQGSMSLHDCIWKSREAPRHGSGRAFGDACGVEVESIRPEIPIVEAIFKTPRVGRGCSVWAAVALYE